MIRDSGTKKKTINNIMYQLMTETDWKSNLCPSSRIEVPSWQIPLKSDIGLAVKARCNLLLVGIQ